MPASWSGRPRSKRQVGGGEGGVPLAPIGDWGVAAWILAPWLRGGFQSLLPRPGVGENRKQHGPATKGLAASHQQQGHVLPFCICAMQARPPISCPVQLGVGCQQQCICWTTLVCKSIKGKQPDLATVQCCLPWLCTWHTFLQKAVSLALAGKEEAEQGHQHQHQRQRQKEAGKQEGAPPETPEEGGAQRPAGPTGKAGVAEGEGEEAGGGEEEEGGEAEAAGG